MNNHNLVRVTFLVVAGFLPYDSVQGRKEGGTRDLNYICIISATLKRTHDRCALSEIGCLDRNLCSNKFCKIIFSEKFIR